MSQEPFARRSNGQTSPGGVWLALLRPDKFSWAQLPRSGSSSPSECECETAGFNTDPPQGPPGPAAYANSGGGWGRSSRYHGGALTPSPWVDGDHPFLLRSLVESLVAGLARTAGCDPRINPRPQVKASVTTRRTCFCVLSTCKNVGKRTASVRGEYRLRTESYGFGSTQTRRRTLSACNTFSTCGLRIYHPCVRVRATRVPRTAYERATYGLLYKDDLTGDCQLVSKMPRKAQKKTTRQDPKKRAAEDTRAASDDEVIRRCTHLQRASVSCRPRTYTLRVTYSLGRPPYVCRKNVADVATTKTYGQKARTASCDRRLTRRVCVLSENERGRSGVDERHSHGCARCKSVVCTPRLADSVRRRYSPRTDALRLPTFLHVDSTQKHVRRVVTDAFNRRSQLAVRAMCVPRTVLASSVLTPHFPVDLLNDHAEHTCTIPVYKDDLTGDCQLVSKMPRKAQKKTTRQDPKKRAAEDTRAASDDEVNRRCTHLQRASTACTRQRSNRTEIVRCKHVQLTYHLRNVRCTQPLTARRVVQTTYLPFTFRPIFGMLTTDSAQKERGVNRKLAAAHGAFLSRLEMGASQTPPGLDSPVAVIYTSGRRALAARKTSSGFQGTSNLAEHQPTTAEITPTYS
ncbi:hypothetical protein Bbelb_142590 [Branchiostoma belcheri]|nr:hypothetical protein Bbelb_142590 [Branchiostoma belcheri]